MTRNLCARLKTRAPTSVEIPSRRRMQRMRHRLEHATIFDWMDSIIVSAARIMRDQHAPVAVDAR